jgi:hypothetical protein
MSSGWCSRRQKPQRKNRPHRQRRLHLLLRRHRVAYPPREPYRLRLRGFEPGRNNGPDVIGGSCVAECETGFGGARGVCALCETGKFKVSKGQVYRSCPGEQSSLTGGKHAPQQVLLSQGNPRDRGGRHGCRRASRAAPRRLRRVGSRPRQPVPRHQHEPTDLSTRHRVP